jgi:predicted ATPase
MIGRQDEVAAITDMLKTPGLVTLTGTGGVGKSRVALRAARTVAGRFAGGAGLVDIGALRNDAIISHVVASALRITDQTARPQLEVLADFLADRDLLLILDSCEHLLSGVASLAQRLLKAAPGLRIIATSRQALRVDGERPLVVLPLPVASEPVSDSELLFLDRVAAVQPGLSVDHSVARRVCGHLDGIPLAIELAARALRTLSVEELLGRIEQRFPLPPDESAAVARHRLLTATIGWSHELCSPGERLLWARLSVFAGYFDRAAAAAVCGAELVDSNLAGLVSKSVLITRDNRYRMLDTIRQYANGWLTALGEEHVLRLRHLNYYRSLAMRCEREWYGPGQVSWFARLAAEHADLRAALDFSTSADVLADLPDAGLELVRALWPLWMGAEHHEGAYYLDRILLAAPGRSPARADALSIRSWLCCVQGDPANGISHARQATEIASGQVLARAVQSHGIGLTTAGECAAGLKTLLAAIGLHEATASDDIMPLVTRGALGMTLSALGRHDEAITTLAEVRKACDARGERWFRSHVDWLSSMAELGRGGIVAAERHAREALLVKRDFADLFGITLCTEMLAGAAAATGNARRAALLHGAGESLYRAFSKSYLVSPIFAVVHEGAERTARQLIGDTAYEATLASGLTLTMNQTIAHALDPF